MTPPRANQSSLTPLILMTPLISLIFPLIFGAFVMEFLAKAGKAVKR